MNLRSHAPEVCALAGLSYILEFGAARPMKMGTIASPWRYDACDALQSAKLRRSAILPHTLQVGVFRYRNVSAFPSISSVPFNAGVNLVGQQPTFALMHDCRRTAKSLYLFI